MSSSGRSTYKSVDLLYKNIPLRDHIKMTDLNIIPNRNNNTRLYSAVIIATLLLLTACIRYLTKQDMDFITVMSMLIMVPAALFYINEVTLIDMKDAHQSVTTPNDIHDLIVTFCKDGHIHLFYATHHERSKFRVRNIIDIRNVIYQLVGGKLNNSNAPLCENIRAQLKYDRGHKINHIRDYKHIMAPLIVSLLETCGFKNKVIIGDSTEVKGLSEIGSKMLVGYSHTCRQEMRICLQLLGLVSEMVANEIISAEVYFYLTALLPSEKRAAVAGHCYGKDPTELIHWYSKEVEITRIAAISLTDHGVVMRGPTIPGFIVDQEESSLIIAEFLVRQKLSEYTVGSAVQNEENNIFHLDRIMMLNDINHELIQLADIKEMTVAGTLNTLYIRAKYNKFLNTFSEYEKVTLPWLEENGDFARIVRYGDEQFEACVKLLGNSESKRYYTKTDSVVHVRLSDSWDVEWWKNHIEGIKILRINGIYNLSWERTLTDEGRNILIKLIAEIGSKAVSDVTSSGLTQATIRAVPNIYKLAISASQGQVDIDAISNISNDLLDFTQKVMASNIINRVRYQATFRNSIKHIDAAIRYRTDLAEKLSGIGICYTGWICDGIDIVPHATTMALADIGIVITSNFLDKSKITLSRMTDNNEGNQLESVAGVKNSMGNYEVSHKNSVPGVYEVYDDTLVCKPTNDCDIGYIVDAIAGYECGSCTQLYSDDLLSLWAMVSIELDQTQTNLIYEHSLSIELCDTCEGSVEDLALDFYDGFIAPEESHRRQIKNWAKIYVIINNIFKTQREQHESPSNNDMTTANNLRITNEELTIEYNTDEDKGEQYVIKNAVNEPNKDRPDSDNQLDTGIEQLYTKYSIVMDNNIVILWDNICDKTEILEWINNCLRGSENHQCEVKISEHIQRCVAEEFGLSRFEAESVFTNNHICEMLHAATEGAVSMCLMAKNNSELAHINSNETLGVNNIEIMDHEREVTVDKTTTKINENSHFDVHDGSFEKTYTSTNSITDKTHYDYEADHDIVQTEAKRYKTQIYCRHRKSLSKVSYDLLKTLSKINIDGGYRRKDENRSKTQKDRTRTKSAKNKKTVHDIITYEQYQSIPSKVDTNYSLRQHGCQQFSRITYYNSQNSEVRSKIS